MFFGDTCSESVHCRHHKCANGATCVPDMAPGNYSCGCVVGTIGRLCETGEWGTCEWTNCDKGQTAALPLRLEALFYQYRHMCQRNSGTCDYIDVDI